MLDIQNHVKPGDKVFVRTVTDHWVGVLVSWDGPYMVTIKDFAWIADSGRLHHFLRDGRAENMEVEPAPDGMQAKIQFLAILNWPHALFREPFPA